MDRYKRKQILAKEARAYRSAALLQAPLYINYIHTWKVYKREE
jgi:hypothetical protein